MNEVNGKCRIRGLAGSSETLSRVFMKISAVDYVGDPPPTHMQM